MNIDKFGHHVHKRLRVSEILDMHNDTLHKSDTGDFDLKQCRLRGLPVPVSNDEAVNKEFVEFALKQYYEKEFDKKVNNLIDSYLKQFKVKLFEALSLSYYTKNEINHFLQNKTHINKNE